MRNRNLLSISILATCLLLISCGGNKNGTDNKETYVAPKDTTPVNETAEYNFLFTIGDRKSVV